MWCNLSSRDTLRVPVQWYSAESTLQTGRKRCLLVAKQAALWGGLNPECHHYDSVPSAGNLLSSQPSFQLLCIFEFKGKHELRFPFLAFLNKRSSWTDLAVHVDTWLSVLASHFTVAVGWERKNPPFPHSSWDTSDYNLLVSSFLCIRLTGKNTLK